MKSILSVLLAIIVAVSCAGCGLNADVSQREGPYEETHFQVNFGELEVDTSNGQFRVSEPMPAGSGEQGEQTEELKMLAELCEKYPDIEENLVRDFNEGELAAVSFTVVPLEKVDGQYLRISTQAESRGSGASDKTEKGEFVIYTSVVGGTLEKGSGYGYTGRTYIDWNTTLVGDSDGPAAGEDYVLQTGPNSFTMLEDFITSGYSARPSKGESTDHWREDAGDNFTKYAIKDYPSVGRCLQEAALVCSYSGPLSTADRKIYSYYVHTWKAMTLGVSIGVSTDKSMTLTLTPGIKDKSWQVCNYVTFNF